MKQMVTKDMIWFEKVGIPSIRKVNSSMLIQWIYGWVWRTCSFQNYCHPQILSLIISGLFQRLIAGLWLFERISFFLFWIDSVLFLEISYMAQDGGASLDFGRTVVQLSMMDGVFLHSPQKFGLWTHRHWQPNESYIRGNSCSMQTL